MPLSDEEFFGQPSPSPDPSPRALSDAEFFGTDAPSASITPATTQAVKDSEALYRERHHMPAGFPEHVEAFLQGAGVPTNLEGLKAVGKFLIRSPVTDVRDIYQAISEVPGRLANFKQTLQGSPAATVYEDPFSKEAFGVYGTAVGMLIPAAEKGISVMKGAREAPEAPPPQFGTPEGLQYLKEQRALEEYQGTPGAEAPGWAGIKQPLQTIEAQIGGEQNAVQPSDAQIPTGPTTFGVETGTSGEVTPASDSDYAVGETQGEPESGAIPGQEPGPASVGTVATEPPPTNELQGEGLPDVTEAEISPETVATGELTPAEPSAAAPATDFELAPPESDTERVARQQSEAESNAALATEAEKKAQVKYGWQQKKTGTTGDLGQMALPGEQPEDLFGAEMTAEQQRELERMKMEEEQGILEDLGQYQKQGGQELVDAIKSVGGINPKSPHFKDLTGHFQEKSKHATQASARSTVGDLRYGDLFSSKAQADDRVALLLKEKGFDVDGPGDLADLLDTRLRNGKPVYGVEARAEAHDITGLGGRGMGAAGAEEIPQAKSVSIKNAEVDKERAARGQLPLMSPIRKSNPKTWDEAMKLIERDPNLGDKMVTDILNGHKKAISETDVAVLHHERIRVANERDMAADRSTDLNASEEDRLAEHLRWAAMEDRVNDIDHATQEAGTISARAQQIRQMIMRDDYTYAGLKRGYEAAKGESVKDQSEVEMLKQEATKIEEADRKADEAEQQEVEKTRETAFQESLGSLREEAKSRKPVNLEEQQGKITQKLKEHAADGESPQDLKSFIQSLALNFVRKGIRDREPLIDAVHGVLKDIFPDMTRRDTMDAISGYGDFKSLDMEAAKVKLRDLKGQMQQLGKIEDMTKLGEAPKKSGIERRTPSDVERRLIKEVNELKKKGGYDVLDPAKALKSAQDAIVTRLNNLIRDREHAMATGEKIPPNKPVPTNAEIDALRVKAAEIGKRYKEAFPVSEAEKRRIAIEAQRTRLQNTIADLEDRIKRGDFSKPTKAKIEVAPENVRLRQNADNLRLAWKRGLYRMEQASAPRWRTYLDKAARIARFGALSGYHTLEKILGYTGWKAAVEVPLTEAAGQVTKFVPGMKAVNARANLEAGPFAKSMARYYRDFAIEGSKEALNVLRNKGETSMKVGQKQLRTPDWTDFFGIAHQAEKSFPLSGQAGLHLEKSTASAIANGVDVSDPIVQSALRKEAVDYAQRSILQEGNRFAQWVNQFNNWMKAPVKSTGRPNPVTTVLADAISALFTKGIIKTPANYVVQSLERTPAGLALGAGKLARTWRYGTDTLSNAEANTIARLWKVGAVGTGFFAWGMMDALKDPSKRVFGGYYQPGEKRDQSDTKWGTIRLGPVTIPWVLAHSPLIESAQLGNTIMRVAMSRLHKHDAANAGMLSGLVGGLFGMFERAPIASSAFRVSDIGEPGKRDRAIYDIFQGLIPQLLQNIAADLDKREGEPVRREPQSIGQALEMGIPGLRQRVPEKRGPRRYGGKNTATAYAGP